MLRKRGQKPSLPVLVSDQFNMLDETGVMSLGLPQEGDADLLYGLSVVAILAKNEHNIEVAHRIAAAHPSSLAICWRGCDVQRVVP